MKFNRPAIIINNNINQIILMRTIIIKLNHKIIRRIKLTEELNNNNINN